MDKAFLLDHVLAEVKRLLPIQNPLFSFLHNNALQAFESQSFFDGIFEASQIYRARTLPSGVTYRSDYTNGRIAHDVLLEAIGHYLKQHPQCPLDLYGVEKVLTVPIKYQTPMPMPATFRSARYWEEEQTLPFRKTIQDGVIPILQSYLDQGQALHLNPYRSVGLVQFFIDTTLAGPCWLRDERYKAALRLKRAQKIPVLKQIEMELIRTGLPTQHWQSYLLELLYDLKGWSGMIQRLSVDSEQRIGGLTQISVEEWLLLLLSLERTLHLVLCRRAFVKPKRISNFCKNTEVLEIKQGERILQALPNEVRQQISLQPLAFLTWLREFGERDRFEIWQKACEWSEERKVIATLQPHFASALQVKPKRIFSAHFMFCIDDREESIRRHLEAQNPNIETSGVVGFFGLDMTFKSVHHPKPIRQCPPVVTPAFVSEELSVLGKDPTLSWSSRLSNFAFRASRTAGRGWIFSILFGHLSLIQMLLRVVAPAWHQRMYVRLKRCFDGVDSTLIQSDFDLHQQASRVELICRMAGLHAESRFPAAVFVVSHGSTTHNNPYRQAYGCGACSGNSGAPNARLFCQFANDPAVRNYLSSKTGFVIPASTLFISAHHDTCSEEFSFTTDPISPAAKKLIDQFLPDILEARKKNAAERLTLLSPNRLLTGDAALSSVLVRSLDLAQPRPEYGHSSVALAVFGRRDLTHAIHMHRQSFLVSYDPMQDPEGKILREVLVGALPVCANIGLDYFFSAADHDRLGAGSKLPLNITSLLGVMTGSRSDLRIGLARQMTEIHRCLRMKVFIEADEALLLCALKSHPRLLALWKNEWVHLYHVDPVTAKITRFLWQ